MEGYYPPVSFHFKVEFTNVSNAENDSRFQSVTGLSVEFDTETFKEGGENRFEHVLPVRTKYPDLVLKRGFLTKDSKVFEWCQNAFQRQVFVGATLLVTLLNEQHEPIKSWNIVNAWPRRWSVTDLNAESNTVVIETLELRYNYFTLN
ncbi:phage tail protein [Rufibacter hautae]|uniref:Phage tail protein n=1 Tax=Rufibacter hautae TaxID=2595005 RepID=A0A5B6TE62_9BACT|nr:phage tail protein [Rufibacter hautae]KAA3438757.1 phage tail protein [Rufibacter hautae]